jgi:hypothetical protein
MAIIRLSDIKDFVNTRYRTACNNGSILTSPVLYNPFLKKQYSNLYWFDYRVV